MNKIVLRPLTLHDSASFYALYNVPGETPEVFTKRILSLCERVYTIRMVEQPMVIIGDCALHHWDRDANSIEIGGSLLPAYWGQNLMAMAFTELEKIAKQDFDIIKLVAKTEDTNAKAIRFAEKFGFLRRELRDGEVILQKVLI